MMMNAVYRNRFIKDLEKARYAPFLAEIKRLIALVLENPFQTPPPYEKLSGRERTYSYGELTDSIDWCILWRQMTPCFL